MRSVAVLASATAVAAPSIAPAAAVTDHLGPSPDAELLALAERCFAAENEWQDACDRKAQLEEEQMGRSVPRPRALRVRKSDRAAGIPPIPGEGWTHYDVPWFVEMLREDVWYSCVKERVETSKYTGTIERKIRPAAEARARADEIVAAYDAWRAKQDKRAIVEANEEELDAGNRASDQQDQLAETPAYTLAGMAAKARVVQAQWRNTELKAGCGALDSELVASIMADLLRLSANA